MTYAHSLISVFNVRQKLNKPLSYPFCTHTELMSASLLRGRTGHVFSCSGAYVWERSYHFYSNKYPISTPKAITYIG